MSPVRTEGPALTMSTVTPASARRALAESTVRTTSTSAPRGEQPAPSGAVSYGNREGAEPAEHPTGIGGPHKASPWIPPGSHLLFSGSNSL